MELVALVVFSCLAGSPSCEPDAAHVYGELIPAPACRGPLGVTLAASWAAANPDRRLASWACVPPTELARVIERVLGDNV